MTLNAKKFRLTLNSFNVVKGLCMLSIVPAHMAYRYPVETLAFPIQLIYRLMPIMAAAMPMFFLIIGYGFKEKPVKKVLKASFQSLIVPYLLVMLIFVALYPITFRLWYGEWAYGLTETIQYAIAFVLGIPKSGKVLFGYNVYHCSAVWFFLTSFVAMNLLNIILKIKNKKLQPFAVILLVIAGYEMLIRDINYFCIGQGFMAAGYFYIGYLMKTTDLFSRYMYKIGTYLVLVPIAVFFTVFCNFNLCLGSFRYGLVDYVASCFVGILLMYLGVYLQRFDEKGLGILDKIGMYTYWIICIHVVENDCMQWWAYKSYFQNQNLAFIGELILKIVIITCGCYLLKKFTYLRYQRKRKQQCNKVNG